MGSRQVLSAARRITAVLFCAVVLALALSGCAGNPEGKIFRYDLTGPVDNLDPQFAATATARMILGNLYEGLVVLTPDGDIEPGVAESHIVSPDRLTYTFALRQDAAWQDGDPLTAADFVFAFRRMFQDGSPHASRYAAIRGADAILNGRSGLSSLGVAADGDHRLVITLDEPDPQFLNKLADPAAAPCNEAAFTDARGRYGLEQKQVFCNGPFLLRTWESSRLLLRQNEHYRSGREAVAGGVNFYIGREAAEQFLDGKSDLALLEWEDYERLTASGGRGETQAIRKTVWCIVFNQNHPLWGNPLLRQGLAHAVDLEMMGENVPAGFRPASALAPDAMRVMGKPYRAAAPLSSPLAFDTEEGKRLFQMGLDMLELSQLPSNATITIPEEAKLHLNMGELQQGWQKYLSAYINFEVVSASQVQSRLRTGDYQMLLLRMTPASSDIDTLLRAFTSGSGQNYFGYHSIVYDELLDSAAAQPAPEPAAARYARAETMLLADAVVIPVYFETTYLATAEGVQGLQISPFGDQITFKYAEKAG